MPAWPLADTYGSMPSPRPIVWLVDDSGLCRRLLCHHLERSGASVEGFSSGDAALATLARVAAAQTPHLVLVDLDMPGRDGLSTAAGLREHGFAGTVALLTASVDVGIRDQARAAGADLVVQKSADRETLVALITRAASAQAA